ncbi:Rds1p [Saccharomyces cerevisiae x Saccharomyces kudriavzevii VIN7]|uniref:Rds1p n=1 Tax=Saccharomyces cerevisiae x Saccharomyces kudriavzevii (strain VIN7) TaxID=1095631 RepID=H0H2T2_SACCK|nr:Rds1p [Saccharomyces cerevisiae x Saccharomyces kudriavzevii VIN7]
MEKTLSRRSRLRLVCLQCKRIKLKCDKLRPVCSRCQQHSLECKYEDSADLSSKVIASGFSSPKTPHASNSEYQSGLKGSAFRCSLQVPEGVINTTLSIWNAEDMLVIVGLVTFVDYPFAAHSLSQHDQYVRALCASLYGMTLIDFSNYANGIPFEDSSRRILGPLSFIEKAILRRIEHSKLFRVQPSALGMLYNGCSIEEDNSVAFLPSLVAEIEGVLVQKKDCEILLKCFYENIYPFYPFMDITLFESNLGTLLLQDDDNRWKINTEGKYVRKKVETLSLLTVIMAMALKHSTLDADLLSMVKTNTSETSTKLTLLCHRLLCLLDVFRYPNESTFTCLLYFYVSEHLDPGSPDCVLNQTNLLTLNHLSNLSITLGLQYEPSNYKRFKDSSLMRHRRMLWLGIQSLKFQISLAEGDSGRSNGEYMELFLANFDEVEATSEDEKSLVGELNMRLHDVTWNKYKLHVILSKLVSSCSSIIRHPQLFEVLENIKRLKDFMSDNFATGLIYQSLKENKLNTIKLGRRYLIPRMWRRLKYS